MNVEEQSRPAVLMIEAAGLAISALVLWVVAYGMQRAVGLLTNGAFHPELSALLFCLLFYVFAGFVSAGTRRQPDHPTSFLANVLLDAAFLGLGWLLWKSVIPASWLGLALSCVALVHGGSYGFAVLRRSRIRLLMQQRAAVQDAFVDRLFLTRSSTYLVIPIGAALGLMLGAADASLLAAQAVAGSFAAVALDQLLRMITDARMRTRTLAKVLIKASDSNAEPRLAAASAEVRRILLINQLQRVTIIAISCLALWQLTP
jgi:hypothetical protein